MTVPRWPGPSVPVMLRERLSMEHDGRPVDPDHVCLPGPLAAVCRLDNAQGPHTRPRSWRCLLHDWMVNAWYRLI